MEIIKTSFGGLSNAYVVRDRATILIDAGCYSDKEKTTKELKKVGVDPKEVSLIVVTHGHFDHAGGIKAAKEATEAKVLCHKTATKFFERGEFPPYKARNNYGQMFIDLVSGAPIDSPAPFTADILVGDDDFDLTPYGVDGKIIYTPGHLHSSITVVLDSGEAFVGDLILANNFDENKVALSLICEDEEEMFESVKRLLDMDVKEFYSGHGERPFTYEEVKAEYKKELAKYKATQ